MNPIKSIPNLLTILNLCCGIIGIQLALSGDLIEASYLILIAVAFDFGDGFAARLLRAQSPIGKQLDSLADLLSFWCTTWIHLSYYFSKIYDCS